MAWSVEFTATAEKQILKLDRPWQTIIVDYLEDEVALLADPRMKGKALMGDKKGLWRYRVGDYRILCHLLDSDFVIVVVTIGHRKDVYKA